MKYCVKCGTLLEDSQVRCIGCGTDLSTADSWSLYPPDVEKTIAIEKKESKSRMGLIIALIAVFVLLVGAIVAFIVINASKGYEPKTEVPKENVEEILKESEDIASDKEAETAETETAEATTQELTKPSLPDSTVQETAEAEEKPASDRVVKDSEGRYYNYGSLADASGETIFTTVYPEDFTVLGKNVNYDIYSTRYPESITYIVGNEDGNVRMTYMSPQHYWYRKSDNKKTRKNERDIFYYMQFYKYDGAKGFIEAMIKESYTDIKGFKFIGSEEYSPDVTKVISDVSNAQTLSLTGEIGDYAKIANDTVYAAMAAECEANIYHYQATSRQNNTIYMDFYVPVMANTLGYVTEYENDKGEVTEWLIPQFVAFEAGNEELYDYYYDAYKLFIANSRPTRKFFYINKAYSDELEVEIAAGNTVKGSKLRLDANKLKELYGKYKENTELGEYGEGVYKLINTEPSQYVIFKSKEDGNSVEITGLENSEVAFYNLEKNKVFISPGKDEYPGDDYTELSK